MVTGPSGLSSAVSGSFGLSIPGVSAVVWSLAQGSKVSSSVAASLGIGVTTERTIGVGSYSILMDGCRG